MLRLVLDALICDVKDRYVSERQTTGNDLLVLVDFDLLKINVGSL